MYLLLFRIDTAFAGYQASPLQPWEIESSISFDSSSNAASSELPCTSAAEVAESVAGGVAS